MEENTPQIVHYRQIWVPPPVPKNPFRWDLLGKIILLTILNLGIIGGMFYFIPSVILAGVVFLFALPIVFAVCFFSSLNQIKNVLNR